jgi:hypothetical protein
MQLTYNTNLPFQPPVPDRQQALESLAAAPRHPQYGSNYADLSRAYAMENAGNYNRAADQANFAYAAGQQGAQQQLALSGLRAMADEQQLQRGLGMSRLQTLQGALSALL